MLGVYKYILWVNGFVIHNFGYEFLCINQGKLYRLESPCLFFNLCLWQNDNGGQIMNYNDINIDKHLYYNKIWDFIKVFYCI